MNFEREMKLFFIILVAIIGSAFAIASDPHIHKQKFMHTEVKHTVTASNKMKYEVGGRNKRVHRAEGPEH